MAGVKGGSQNPGEVARREMPDESAVMLRADGILLRRPPFRHGWEVLGAVGRERFEAICGELAKVAVSEAAADSRVIAAAFSRIAGEAVRPPNPAAVDDPRRLAFEDALESFTKAGLNLLRVWRETDANGRNHPPIVVNYPKGVPPLEELITELSVITKLPTVRQ
ncbi:MAG TPA: hypothetical protein VKZ50_07270 [bacterium]|nr:hypothetical protein [bacterium]